MIKLHYNYISGLGSKVSLTELLRGMASPYKMSLAAAMLADEVAALTDRALDRQSATASSLSTVNLCTMDISTWQASVVTIKQFQIYTGNI